MPDDDLYCRSNLEARKKMITKSVLCVIGNSDILQGCYTNGDIRYKEIMHHLNFSLYTARKQGRRQKAEVKKPKNEREASTNSSVRW
jgi:hypothetical protein